MSDYRSKIFSNLAKQDSEKFDASALFQQIKAKAERSMEQTGDEIKSLSSSNSFQTKIFDKFKKEEISLDKEENSDWAKRIFGQLQQKSENLSKVAFFVTQESLAEIQEIASALNEYRDYQCYLFFDQVDLENQEKLTEQFSNFSLNFDYKLYTPEALTKKFDLIIVLSADEFSHRLAIESLRNGKNSVSTMTIQGGMTTGRHYNADSVEKLLKILPNILK